MAQLKADNAEIERQVEDEWKEKRKLRSTVIVLFPLTVKEVDKYDFEGRLDEERIKELKKKYVGIGSKETATITFDGVKDMLGTFGGPKVNEIQTKSEEEKSLKQLEGAIVEAADNRIMLAPGFMTHGFDPGHQRFDLASKNKVVVDMEVFIPKSSNIYCILKRNPDGSLALDRFIPDITKPQSAP